ncbi:MAG: RNA polymerase sigma factor [Dysgonamonadaceae bacterium]|jgi:RNA polymerase sigma-70 factor (ECF subfamily)|nr:RNA polymerase sigma factor [Dysgonamonadaceae bacterium]
MKQDKFRNRILPLGDKLFRLALRITGNRQDAEDVVQDMLLNIWKKKGEWDSIANLEAYCFRSTRNLALDKMSSQQHQQGTFDENQDIPEIGSNIQEQLEQEEQLALLENYVNRLSEKQRTIFQLREVEGLSYKQIAGIMTISEEQVKVNLFRLRQKLKEFFEIKSV